MVPPIKELITSVQKILAHHKIDAPLMLVKGDGSLASLDNAIEKPIGTVLSGPAASVIGACQLSGLDNAIVADMGGTTTDIAVVSNGQPQLSADGANIGDWKPMVEAVRVSSIGLGGDSEVRFGGHKGLSVGPRRVVPTSLLAHLYPEVIPKLEAQLEGMASARSNRFVMRLENNQALLQQLNKVEMEAWELLSDKPVELDAIVQENRNYARALAKLKRLGLAIYSGFTPSDAVHVLGINSHWDRHAAELSARIWMRQMRFLYGYGKWDSDDIETACRQVYDLVTDSIRRLLVEVGLNELPGAQAPVQPGFRQRLPDRRGRRAGSELLPGCRRQHVHRAAPARAWRCRQCLRRGHGQRDSALFHEDQPQNFESLEAAKREASEIATRIARQKALEAGAIDPSVTLAYDEVHVKDDVDGELFLESTVIATAIGPACNWRSGSAA
jgi:hypothetical protein